jgi:predicted secreted protein
VTRRRAAAAAVRAAAAALAAAALLMTVAGCGGDDVKTFEDPHGKIEVKNGERFALQFTVNSGVGYDWRAVGLPAGVALVQLKKTSVHYPDEERAGESGDKRFEYEAKGVGEQTLTFVRNFRGKDDERRAVVVSIAGD